MQKLILPIDDADITAGYLSQKYYTQFGYHHYGVDIVSKVGDTAVRSMGRGTVIAAGLDGSVGDKSGLGYVIVIRYNEVDVLTKTNPVNLIATFCHLERNSIRVKANDAVNTGDIIANYGNTGGSTTGPHLHLQFDTDTNYPLHMYGISAMGHLILKKGTIDSTVNPYSVLNIGPNQSARTKYSNWAEDYSRLRYSSYDYFEQLQQTVEELYDIIEEMREYYNG